MGDVNSEVELNSVTVTAKGVIALSGHRRDCVGHCQRGGSVPSERKQGRGDSGTLPQL